MRKKMILIIANLLVEHNIEVKKWRKTNTGKAYVKKRKIEIPHPTTIERFCTCLHEIEHIIHPEATLHVSPAWKSEYIACSQSEIKCEQYGFEVTEKERNRNKNYIKLIIIRNITADSSAFKSIDKHILSYADIDKIEWEKHLNQGFIPKLEVVKGLLEEVSITWIEKKKLALSFEKEVLSLLDKIEKYEEKSLL